MKNYKISLLTLFIGVVNIVINKIVEYAFIYDITDVFLLNVHKYLYIYIFAISEIVTAFMIYLILKEIKLKKSHHIIILSLVINIIYAVIYYNTVKNIFIWSLSV